MDRSAGRGAFGDVYQRDGAAQFERLERHDSRECSGGPRANKPAGRHRAHQGSLRIGIKQQAPDYGFYNVGVFPGGCANRRPGVSDPLNQPVQPIATLDQFHPRQTLQHRISIGGIATFVDTNLNFFFVQDADSGVRVETAGNSQVKPGDYVIASGYPGLGSYGNLLQDAVFKVISQREIPPPRQISEGNPIDARLHDRWVQAEARFLHYSKIGDVDTLTLQIGNKVFDVRIITPVSARIKNLESGSLLQIAGIYRVLSDEARVPKSLQLAVPSEQEIQVLEEPSWWTVKHTAMVLGVMAVTIGAAVLWVLLLRRKVRQQTASLRQSESKFRSLVEQSLVGVYIIQNDRFVYANPRLAEIFGYTREEPAIPLKLDDVIMPEDLALMREQIRRWLADETDSPHHSSGDGARTAPSSSSKCSAAALNPAASPPCWAR